MNKGGRPEPGLVWRMDLEFRDYAALVAEPPEGGAADSPAILQEHGSLLKQEVSPSSPYSASLYR